MLVNNRTKWKRSIQRIRLTGGRLGDGLEGRPRSALCYARWFGRAEAGVLTAA